jgi:hypothetical protein
VTIVREEELQEYLNKLNAPAEEVVEAGEAISEVQAEAAGEAAADETANE